MVQEESRSQQMSTVSLREDDLLAFGQLCNHLLRLKGLAQAKVFLPRRFLDFTATLFNQT